MKHYAKVSISWSDGEDIGCVSRKSKCPNNRFAVGYISQPLTDVIADLPRPFQTLAEAIIILAEYKAPDLDEFFPDEVERLVTAAEEYVSKWQKHDAALAEKARNLREKDQ